MKFEKVRMLHLNLFLDALFQDDFFFLMSFSNGFEKLVTSSETTFWFL